MSDSQVLAKYGQTRVSPVRVAGVTSGLVMAGAVMGAITAIAWSVGWAILHGEMAALLSFSLALPVVIGGALGATIGPVIAWLFLRRVPLGLGILGTSIGALAGASLSAFARNPSATMLFGGAILGAVAAAAAMWWPRGGNLSKLVNGEW